MQTPHPPDHFSREVVGSAGHEGRAKLGGVGKQDLRNLQLYHVVFTFLLRAPTLVLILSNPRM